MKTRTFVISVFILFLSTVISYGFDYRPYVETGGKKLSENGTSEGHKHYTLAGIDIIKPGKFIFTHKLEGFFMAEAEDDDPEMLHNGFRFGSEIKNNKNFTSYIGLYYNQWNRKQNQKYPKSFDQFNFVEATFGFEYSYKKICSRIGFNYPVWVEHLTGRPDLTAEIGYRHSGLELGFRYRKISFGGNENQPIIRAAFPGIFVGYKF